MSEIPAELRYASSHEWIRDDGDGTATVGITDHAQEALGDLVFVEVPEVGREVSATEACAVVESVKAASDIYSPVAGTIIAVNGSLADKPEVINEEPYGEGWVFRLRMANADAMANLLDAAGYEQAIADED